MQTDVKNSYDAALPGNLLVLPSFRGGAEVLSCTATTDSTNQQIYPGDPVYYYSGSSNLVCPATKTMAAKFVIGVAVRSHTNFDREPKIATTEGGISNKTPIGIVINGPIWVKWNKTGSPKINDYASWGDRDSDGYTTWGVSAAGATTRFRFATTPQQGDVIGIYVDSGAPMTA